MGSQIDLVQLYNSSFEGSPNTVPDNLPEETDLIKLYNSRSSLPEQPIGGRFEYEKYSPYLGEMFNPEDPGLDERRARAQSGWQLAGNAIGQGLAEFGMGAVEAVGYALDFEELINADKQATEGFDNAFSRAIREAKEHVQEEWFPIYQTQTSQEGSLMERLGDRTFWAAQGKTIGTTLSLIAPAVLTGGAASGAMTALGMSKAAAQVGRGIVAGLVSRKAESAMEAYQSWQENYNKFLGEGLPDIEARERAGEIAANVFKANRAMMPLDMLQYTLALKSFSGIKKAIEGVGKTTAGGIASFGTQVISEAAEEGYQNIAAREAEAAEELGITPFGEDFSERLSEYVKDPEFHTEAFLGGAMGAVFGGMGPVMRKTSEAVKKSTARMLASANLNDLASFDKVTNQVQGRILAKAYMAGNLDRVESMLDNLSTEAQKQDDPQGYLNKIQKFKERINFLREQDEFRSRDPKFEENPKTRKELVLTELEGKMLDDNISEWEGEVSNLKSVKDIRDEAVLLHKEKQMLQKSVREFEDMLADPEQLEKSQYKKSDLETIISEINKDIEEVNNSLNDAIKQAKEIDKNFIVEKYNSPNADQIADLNNKIAWAKQRRKVVESKAIHTLSNISPEEASKREKALIKEETDRLNKMIGESVRNLSPVEAREILDQYKGTPAEKQIRLSIDEKAEEEMPDYDSTNVGEIYSEAPFSYVKDMDELSDKLEKFKDNEDLANTIYSITKSNKPEEIDSALNYARDRAKSNDDFFKLVQTIDEFYKERQKQFEESFKRQERDTVELVEVVPELAEKTPTAKREVKTRPWQTMLHQYTIDEDTETGEWVFRLDKPQDTLAHGRYTQEPIDWKALNDPENFLPGTKIEFEINLSGKYSPLKTGWETFQVQIIAKDKTGQRKIVGILSAADTALADDPNYNNLVDLRKELYGLYESFKGKKEPGRKILTGITGVIDFKSSGRIKQVKKFYSPKEVAGDQPLVLGVVSEKNGQKFVKGLPDEYLGYAGEDFLKKAKPGNVYMFMQAANGEYIPLRLFTKKVADFTKKGKNPIKQRVYVKLMEMFKPKTNLGDISQDIKADVYLNFKLNHKEDKLTIYKSGKPVDFSIKGLKKRDEVEMEKFSRLMDDMVVQIDARKINTTLPDGTSFNESISDRLSINVDPNEPFHSAWVSISPEWNMESKTKTVAFKVEPEPEYKEVLGKETKTTAPVNPPIATKFDKIPDEDVAELREIMKKQAAEEVGMLAEEEIPIEVRKAQAKEAIAEEDFGLFGKEEFKVAEKGKIPKKELPKEPSAEDIAKQNKGGNNRFRLRPVDVDLREEYDVVGTIEEGWFKKTFPKVNPAVIDDINEVNTHGGRLAWGIFEEGMVRVYKAAKVGTYYHEGFHVVFHMFLNNNDQVKILEDVREPGMSDIDAEEKLAEMFVEYMATEGKSKTISQRIGDFFRRLYRLMKYYFSGEITPELIFDRMRSSYYSKSSIIRGQEQLKGIIRNSVLIEGLNYTETDARATNVADAMRLALNEFKQDHPDDTRAGFIQSYLNQVVERERADGSKYTVTGLDLLLEEAFNTFTGYREYLQKNKKLTKEIDYQLGRILNNIVQLDDAGRLPEGRYKLKRLGDLALRRLARTEGILLNTDRASYVEFGDTTESDIYEFNENEDKREGWQKDSLEAALWGNARAEVKTELSYIPMLNRKGEPIRDKIGRPIYMQPSVTFGTLIKELSGFNKSSLMLAQLKDYAEAHPEYKSLVDKVESDEGFRTKFFNAFENTHITFNAMTRSKNPKTGVYTYKLLHTNQGSTINLVDTWKYNYHNPNVNALLDKNNLLKRSKRLEELYEAVKKDPKDLEKFSELLTSIGMEATVDELKMLVNLKKMDKFRKHILPISRMMLDKMDPFEGERSQTEDLRAAAYLLTRTRQEESESSHVAIDRKNRYSHSQSFFISKQIESLKNPETRAEYLRDPFYSNMPWLKRMGATDLETKRKYAEDFGFSLFEGKRWDTDSNGTPYSKIADNDLEIAKIQAFFAGGQMPHYMMPPLSDSPVSIMIRGEKFDKTSDIVELMYQVALSEWERIKSDPIVRTNTYIQKFHFIKPLNDHMNLFGKEIQTEEVKKVIEQYLEDKYQELITDLKKMNIIKEKDGKFQSDILNVSGSLERALRIYSDNSIFAGTQMIALFQGDPAYYNSVEDFYKRAKEAWSPGKILDRDAKFIRNGKLVRKVRDSYKTIYVNDVKITNKELANAIKNALIANNVDKEKAYMIAAQYGFDTGIELRDENGTRQAASTDNRITKIVIKKNKKGILETKYYQGKKEIEVTAPFYVTKETNVTDAQAFISIDRYAEIQLGLGRWSGLLEDAVQDMKAGRISDISLNPLKPFMFTHKKLSKGDIRQFIPTQNKNSEFLLVPALAYATKEGVVLPTAKDRKGGYDKYLSPTLAKILDVMQRDSYEDKTSIDSVQFDSAVKVGLYGNMSLDKIDQAEVHYLSNEDFRISQEVPDHFTDDKGRIGTQGRKLIISDIDPEAIFSLYGKDYSKEELLGLYQEIVSADIVEAFAEVDNRFDTIESIRDLLMEEVRREEMGPEMEAALEITESEEGVKRFKLPLFTPFHARRIESLISSVYRNKVVNQKAPGGNLVQVSGVGFMNDLKIVIEKGRIKWIECRLPYWMKEEYPDLFKGGKPDIKAFEKYGLDKLIGYRIPTEDKYSMLPLKIVGFLPRESGGGIMLPPEITTLTGSDFDVDKIYIHLPAFKLTKEGTIERHTFNIKASKEWYKEWVRKTASKDSKEYVQYLSIQEKERLVKEAQNKFDEFQNKFNFKESIRTLKESLKQGDIQEYISELNKARKELLSKLDEDVRNQFTNIKDKLDDNDIRGIERVEYYIKAINTSTNVDEYTQSIFDDMLQIHSEELRMYGLKKETIENYINKFKESQKQGLEVVKEEQSNLFKKFEDEITEYLVELNGLEKYESFKKSAENNPAKYNSRKARDNAKLDLFWSVLTNKDTFEKFINPGGFESLTELNNKIKDLLNISEEDMDLATPRTTRLMFSRYMASTALRGIFVNHNINHAITQHSQLELVNPIELNGRTITSLYDVKDEDGKYISRNLAEILAAVLDDVKNPITSFLNINMFTSDILSILVRTGYSLDTAIAFLNQPSIRSLVEEYHREGQTSEAYRRVYRKYIDIAKSEAGKPVNTFDITTDQMMEDIAGEKTPEYYARQLALLELFNRLREDSFTVGSLVNVLRTDNSRRQLTMSANEVMQRDRINLIDQKVLKNVESVWENFKMMEVFYDNAVNKVNDRLREYFPWSNQALRKVKLRIMNNLSENKRPSKDQIDYLNMEFMNFLASSFFGDKNREDLFKNFPDAFNKYVKEHPELKDNRFVKGLSVEPKKVNNTNYDLITYRVAGKFTDIEKAEVSLAWLDLFENHNDFAYKLFQYAYYTNGFHMGPKSFSHLVPVGFYTNWRKDNNKENPTFGEFLYNLLDETQSDIRYDEFYHQFYKNNWHNKFWVPEIARKEFPDRYHHKSTDPVIRSVRGELVDYITLNNKGKKQLYRLVEETAEQAIYKKEPHLSVKNVLKRYSRSDNFEQVNETKQPDVELEQMEDGDEIPVVESGIEFYEYKGGYRERTIKNASADATIALAVDFTSAGERQTKNSVLSQKKKYIPIDANDLSITPERVDKIVNALNSVNAKTLNIAGNGIYTMRGKYTQKQVDDFTYELLKAVIESPNLKNSLDHIRTGGQTGFDEAGAKAGAKLGIKTYVLAPGGWKFRTKRGDIYNEQSFKARFQEESQEVSPSYYTGNIKPEPNTVFVFGSNPEGRHGAGAAKVAREQFGAKYGQGEGLQGNAYALPTKDLRVKENKGLRSISPEQITESIKTLYDVARQNPDKQFKVAYRNTTETTLNGYTGLEMIEMFNKAGEIPSNVIFSKEWVDTGKLNNQIIEESPFEDNLTISKLKTIPTGMKVLEYSKRLDELARDSNISLEDFKKFLDHLKLC